VRAGSLRLAALLLIEDTAGVVSRPAEEIEETDPVVIGCGPTEESIVHLGRVPGTLRALWSRFDRAEPALFEQALHFGVIDLPEIHEPLPHGEK
jgi:hypothetical protein